LYTELSGGSLTTYNADPLLLSVSPDGSGTSRLTLSINTSVDLGSIIGDSSKLHAEKINPYNMNQISFIF
jgi:hypothetical protein